MVFLTQFGKDKKIKPLKINLEIMEFYQRRQESRRDKHKLAGVGESSLEESYAIITAVDPDLKETTKKIRENFISEDDL